MTSWKSFRWSLLALAAAPTIIPGLQYFAAPDWWPPQSDLFRVIASIVTAASLGITLMAGDRVRRWRPRRAGRIVTASLVGSVVLLVAYDFTLRRSVHPYTWDHRVLRPVVPLCIPCWIDDDLVRIVRNLPSADNAGKDRHSITAVDVEEAFRILGPGDMNGRMPLAWRGLTVAVLVAQYSVALGLVTFTFTVLALRMEKAVTADAPAGSPSRRDPSDPEELVPAAAGPADAAPQGPRRAPRRPRKTPRPAG